MARLSDDEYLSFLRSESARFRDVLAGTDPGARVPSCPAWDAGDLLWHLTEVQHFWGWVITHRPADGDGVAHPGRPGSHHDLLEAFDDAHTGLVTALEKADPADEAWTWSQDHTVGFILRRQAHEALIHRVDAELAAGDRTPLDPALAADGVEEVLDVMYGGCPPWGSFSPLPHLLRLDVTDADASVWVQRGRFSGTDPADGTHYEEDDIAVVPDPGSEPDAVISGDAEVLDLRLWRRGDGAGTHLTGDLRIVDKFRQIVHEPIT
jgi:uncharacterized protein (TIGR03083 family)